MTNSKNRKQQSDYHKEQIADLLAGMKVKPEGKNKNSKITLRQIVMDDKERFQRMMTLIDLFEKS